jgi:hypothetical protein
LGQLLNPSQKDSTVMGIPGKKLIGRQTQIWKQKQDLIVPLRLLIASFTVCVTRGRILGSFTLGII